ncbi:MAG: ribosomal-processing cysteine protease Prp [Lachnospiraceae bacterium]
MIAVTVLRDGDRISGFESSGHAGFADSGKDIVCAAVSILIINTVNSMEEFTGQVFGTESEDGHIYCTLAKPYDQDAQLLLNAMVFGLQNIRQEYGKKYLRLDFKEV